MSDHSNIPTAILCIGSNTPHRISNIEAAIHAIEPFCDFIDRTEPYECPDDSGLGEPYVNVVLSCQTKVNLQNFREILKGLEVQFGRDSSSKNTGIMPLDIDIVVWHGLIIDQYEYSRPYFRKGYDLLQIKKRLAF